MLDTLRQLKVARVLFDEEHGEAWSIRPEAAAAMQPGHPADSSYAGAAAVLAARDFEVAVHSGGPLTPEALGDVDVLVIAHPSEARWEHTVNANPPVFAAAELDAIEAFVERGGGLLVLGEEEQDKYGNNLNELLARFGLRVEHRIVFDYERSDGTPTWVVGEAAPGAASPTLLHRVGEVTFARAGTLVAEDESAILVRTSDAADPPRAGLLAAVARGAGRVVAVADSDLFGDDFFDREAHQRLWQNVVYWLGLPAFEAEREPVASPAAADPAWLHLKEATNALRALQEPNGEVDLAEHGASKVREHVEAMTTSIAGLAPRFPHEADYLAQVRADLAAWVDGGCAKPDFRASLALFRPEQHRIDGLESLVVFPMYTPNGSPDTRFEALIVRTPWPEFIDRLERESYDNDKFVPVMLVDNTDGYDSECAVLFPETVSVAERPTNNFGGIFCDRESARFRRTMSVAHEALHIDLPPDAVALMASADLSLQTYILWDIIHDSWHSHGDLPFDPFMIRQRLPYWMYSLEELRVDLSAYVDAGRLAREGFPFARYVQYAMLFDRIVRFPITGNRVRNYDGLGGQLLFGFLHQKGVVAWTDNRLVVDWDNVEEAVAELRDRLSELYRDGIDLSKVSYWSAAHDLVAEYVTPNVASQWTAAGRTLSDEGDPKAWIDRVLDDEFPLSMFYEQVRKKLEAPAPVAVG